MSSHLSAPVPNPRMQTARSVVGLIGVVGLSATLFFALAEDGFEFDTWVWALAFAAALVFWYQAGQFLQAPNQARLGSLKPASYSFTVLWILGVVATYLVWETLFPETYAGVGVGILGSFLTIQFSNDAAAELARTG